jgi:hypothetical protein
MPARKPAPTPPKRTNPRLNPKPQGHPPFVPTEQERELVSYMAAGGVEHAAICGAIGSARRKQARKAGNPNAAGIKNPALMTLRKHFRSELDDGIAVVSSFVIGAHLKRIQAGDMHAIKWWEQARLGWKESILVDDGKPADQPMRVIIEYVGEAGPPRVEAAAPRTGSRLPEEVRRNVQLVG